MGSSVFKESSPEHPYPIEFVKASHWNTVDEVVNWMKNAGFKNLKFIQTLTRHPKYSNLEVEDPIPGYDKGDYIAIKGEK